MVLKRYEEALAAYAKVLSIKPDLAGAWLGRGNVYSELKRYDEAYAAYDKALSIEPELAEVHHARANIRTWTMQAGKLVQTYLICCHPRHQKQRPTVQHILKRIASTAAKDNQFNKAQAVTARSPLQRR